MKIEKNGTETYLSLKELNGNEWLRDKTSQMSK